MTDYSSLFTGKPLENATPPGKPEPYRLLLVDDEPNILSSLQRMFRKENYKISTAASAQEALNILDREKFHLIISDQMMPGMSGAELLQQVRERYPDTIRIMLTGHADTSAVMGAIRDGAVYRFIIKPAQEDDLRVSVALALEQYDIVQKNKELLAENSKQSKEIKALSQLAVTSKSQLPALLNKHGFISAKQMQELYHLQSMKKIPMLKVLLERDWVGEQQIKKLLCQEFLLEEIALHEFQVSPRATELIPRSFCIKQQVLPLQLKDKQLLLAMVDPSDQEMLKNLRFITGMQIEPVLVDLNALESKIAAIYGTGGDEDSFQDIATVIETSDPLDTIEIVIEEEDDIPINELLMATQEPPAIRLVNAIILEGIRHDASDIHIQPHAKNVIVRYRIDGILLDKIQIPLDLHKQLVSRIKIMAELDIAERRHPQDGRITVKSPLKIVDLRLSTLPTMNGEKIVMRLLDRNASIHTIDELGFSDINLQRIMNMVDTPQGIILATGPTGSGKTTTLYSLLQHNVSSQKNYVTIEDPVEYYLDTAAQVHILEKIGLDFSTVLRSVLRQDPDVILLGEIRDPDTAQVAFNAALTGHQVFSTLHSNSAVETVARLIDLGLRPYIIASALLGVIAQRLVRKICRHCKEPVQADPGTLQRLGPFFSGPSLQTFAGKGCTHCNHTGYSGRYPLHEVLILNERMQHLLSQGRSIVEIGRAATEDKTVFLIEDARNKVNKGYTTVSEVFRVLGPQVIG
jgi:type II secretory ATPase GspE/PulE/Tfp pilus assembly ATPase PilB-like protein/DNA-binding response OmpR family regulator